MLNTTNLVKQLDGNEIKLGFRAPPSHIEELYNYFYNSGATNGKLTIVTDNFGCCICPFKQFRKALICRIETELETDCEVYKRNKPAREIIAKKRTQRKLFERCPEILRKHAEDLFKIWLDSIPDDSLSYRESGNFSTYRLAL